MVVFFLALLLIAAVAVAVVAAFAMPQLRAGSPVLTDRGTRLARSWSHRLRPVTRVVVPVLRPVARNVGHAVRPLVGRLRPKVAPLTRAISRAVEEGTALSPVIRRPGVSVASASGRSTGSGSGGAASSDSADGDGESDPAGGTVAVDAGSSFGRRVLATASRTPAVVTPFARR